MKGHLERKRVSGNGGCVSAQNFSYFNVIIKLLRKMRGN